MRPEQEFIKFDECPVCKSAASDWTIGHRHTCGNYSETVKFVCGCVYQYVPNFGSIRVETPCPQAHRVAIHLLSER